MNKLSKIKFWLISHRYQILALALTITLFIIIGCATQNSAPSAPSGPIGGGCG